MTNLFTAASIVLVLTGVAHSVVGEIMIFRKLSNGKIIPNQSASPLKERNIRILWAGWHLTTVFGLVLASLLFKAGNSNPPSITWISNSVSAACFAGGLLVLPGTKGRHPGWISLMLAATLTWLAAHAV